MEQQSNKSNNKLKPKQRGKKATNRRPSGFREFEALAKGILEGEGISYFDWLHEQHQKIILDFNLSKKKEVADLAREDD